MSEKFYLPYHYFICHECDENKEMTTKEFAAHIRVEHQINEKKGEKSLVLHISKKPRHTSTYKWVIGGRTFYEYFG